MKTALVLRKGLKAYVEEQAVLSCRQKRLLVSLYTINGLMVFWVLMRWSFSPSFSQVTLIQFLMKQRK